MYDWAWSIPDEELEKVYQELKDEYLQTKSKDALDRLFVLGGWQDVSKWLTAQGIDPMQVVRRQY
jgi:hypothetical protein